MNSVRDLIAYVRDLDAAKRAKVRHYPVGRDGFYVQGRSSGLSVIYHGSSYSAQDIDGGTVEVLLDDEDDIRMWVNVKDARKMIDAVL